MNPGYTPHESMTYPRMNPDSCGGMTQIHGGITKIHGGYDLNSWVSLGFISGYFPERLGDFFYDSLGSMSRIHDRNHKGSMYPIQ
ncbi:hypothetical protein QJS10_CPB19g01085 [Acorus calamus]|uniref:Uncharacterized protein n=1 Tax=Acorus calamus TaxID=4465 RepID=A0AAV9CF33_ACOCL|nr:hypothetical protein QJS10_CPB19g01085 [Acorus calamus]